MNATVHLILLGAPGSGKGTQSQLLINKYSFKHISTGNMLREEISKNTALGKEVEVVMKSGSLVSDDLVTKLLKANLSLDGNKYIFDGYPRTKPQAEILVEDVLKGQKFKVIYFNINHQVVIDRLSNRRMTADGKYIYNLKTNPPKKSGICDVTGEKLIQRNDDKEEVIRSRLDVFDKTVLDLKKYFDTQLFNWVELDASLSSELLFKKIEDLIN